MADQRHPSPEALFPKDRELLHHLTCPVCGRWDLDQALVEPAPYPEDGTWAEETREIDGGFWKRLEAKAPWVAAEASRRREEAEALFRELTALPPERRERAIQAARFRSLDLLEDLLAAGREAQRTGPEEAKSLAACAVLLAQALGDEHPDEARPALVRALCLEANAARLRGDRLRAEAAVEEAAGFVTDLEDRAEHCRTVALLRWERGHADEAAALLERAWGLYRLLEDADAQAVCAALLGLLHAEQAWHGSALLFLLRAWRDLDRGACPELALRAGLALAQAFAIERQPERAREVLREAWRLQKRVSDGAEGIRACWHEARVLSRLGQVEEARHLLTSARDRLAEEGSLPEAFLVSLDLAVLHAEAGELAEIPALAAVLEARFSGAPKPAKRPASLPQHLALARDVLLGFHDEAAAGKPNLRDAAEGVAAVQRRTFRLLGLPLRPIPFV
jgi:hypothetical protein